jgi:transcriptional regulator GlxA family with amidase domain
MTVTALGSRTAPPHRVVVLALDSVVAFELGLPHRFFAANSIDPAWTGASAYTPSRPPAYEVLTVTVDDGPVTTSAAYQVIPTHPHTVLSTADTIVVPGMVDRYAAGDGTLPADLAALLATARPGVRWVSICTGAFVLAAAGLLDGRDCTTHWRHAGKLAAAFPAARVNPDVLYICDGPICTSAGSAAGLDLCLHLIRQDYGEHIANIVARRMVMPPHRAGGQAQFVQTPVRACESEMLAPLLDQIIGDLSVEHTVESMAQRASMSGRTFARRFRDEVGTTPHVWLTQQRVRHARHLLESGDDPVETVAQRAGFGTAAMLRHHFARVVGTSPVDYRRTFRGSAG